MIETIRTCAVGGGDSCKGGTLESSGVFTQRETTLQQEVSESSSQRSSGTRGSCCWAFVDLRSRPGVRGEILSQGC